MSISALITSSSTSPSARRQRLARLTPAAAHGYTAWAVASSIELAVELRAPSSRMHMYMYVRMHSAAGCGYRLRSLQKINSVRIRARRMIDRVVHPQSGKLQAGSSGVFERLRGFHSLWTRLQTMIERRFSPMADDDRLVPAASRSTEASTSSIARSKSLSARPPLLASLLVGSSLPPVPVSVVEEKNERALRIAPVSGVASNTFPRYLRLAQRAGSQFLSGGVGAAVLLSKPVVPLLVVAVVVSLLYLLGSILFEHAMHSLLLQGMVMWTDVRASRAAPCVSAADLVPSSAVLRIHGSMTDTTRSATGSTKTTASKLIDPSLRAKLFASSAVPASNTVVDLPRAAHLTDWIAVKGIAPSPPSIPSTNNASIDPDLWTSALQTPVSCPHPMTIFRTISLLKLGSAPHAHNPHDLVRFQGVFRASRDVGYVHAAVITVGTETHLSSLTSSLGVNERDSSPRIIQFPVSNSAESVLLVVRFCLAVDQAELPASTSESTSVTDDDAGSSDSAPAPTKSSFARLLARWFVGGKAPASREAEQVAARNLLRHHVEALTMQTFRFVEFGHPPRAATMLTAPVLMAVEESDRAEVMWESNCHVSAHAIDFGSAEAEPTSLRHRLVSVHTKQIDDDHYVHRVIVPVSSKGIEAAPVRSTLGAEAESIGRPVDSVANTEPVETKAPAVSDFFAHSDADVKKDVDKVQSEAEGHYFFYQVLSGATASRVYRARIPSAKQADIAIAFIGDTQYGARTFRHHLWHLSLQKPELLVHVGDMVHDGLSIKEWRTYWTGPLEQAALGSSLPLLTVRGNHDGESPLAFAYLHSNPGGWFAYNAGPIRFVVLNTNLPINANDVQTKWLESELQSEASRSATYLIVLMHVPAFVDFWDTAAWTHGDSKPTAAVRRVWVPLFERNHVSMVISGHSHVYQRGSLNGVVYTIVGGGGGALDVDRVADTIYSKTSHTHHHAMLRASHAQLEWVVHDIGESEIDRVTIDAMQRGRA